MQVTRVEYVNERTKKDYIKKLNELRKRFQLNGIDYDVIESRYNGRKNGYRAEVPYWFWIEQSYYEYYC